LVAITSTTSAVPAEIDSRDEATETAPDYFVERDGERFAGLHLLIEMWGAHGLDDRVAIERILRDAVAAARATVLHSHFHRFETGGGISGVLVLAESHIGIHTWPERDFAAIDIFMCGACDPYDCLPVLRREFAPRTFDVEEKRRGRAR
jgi:S-adenosylmethionine decarboxylase